MPTRKRRVALVGAGGVLLGLSFPPFPFAPMAWIALVPVLILWLEHTSARAVFTDTWIAFLITFAVAFHWPLFHAYPATAVLSFPGLVVIPLWMAVPFGLSAALRRRAGAAGGLVLLAASFVLMEWALRRGPLAFPWSLLGHSQAELEPVNRLARVGGVPLLTTWVLILNLLVLTLLGRVRRLRLPLIGLAAAGAILMLVPFDDEVNEERLRVGIIQPAVSAHEWADFDNMRRIGMLIALSDTLVSAASEPPDLVVWPETALPPGRDAARLAVQHWTEAWGVPVLTGAVIEAPGESPGYYNAALFVHPGAPTQIYRKRRLVPFAEAVPLQDRWPWLRRLAVPSGGVSGYAVGETGDLMEIRNVPFGVLICFETLFDDLARAYARDGAALMVAVTQDGWWGRSFGHRQHLAFNRLRALETGRPLVQVSVSGISAVVYPNGDIGERIGWMERKAAVVTVSAARSRTPYIRWGDLVTPAAAVVIAMILLMCTIRRNR